MSNKGFSLIEMLVVIAIMGIVMSIATLNFNSWNKKVQIERQTRELFADLNQARIDSVHRKQRHSIVMNPNNYILKRYSSPNESATAGGTPISSKDLRYLISTMTGTFTGSNGDYHVVFDTRGFVEAINPPTIRVNPSDSSAAIDCIVVSTGRTNLGKVEANACVQK